MMSCDVNTTTFETGIASSLFDGYVAETFCMTYKDVTAIKGDPGKAVH